jgi:hypothetical protein
MSNKIDKSAGFFLSYMFIFGAVAISLIGVLTKSDVTGVIVLFLWAAFYYVQKKLEDTKKKKVTERRVKL